MKGVKDSAQAADMANQMCTHRSVGWVAENPNQNLRHNEFRDKLLSLPYHRIYF